MADLPPDVYKNYLSDQIRNAYGSYSGMSRLKKDYHVANILPHVRQELDSPILEIGPGFGEFLEAVLERGYRNVRAVDISGEVVGHILNKYPSVAVEHIKSLYEYLISKPQFFLTIVLLDVIEHFPKEETIPLLRAMRGALAPGGSLIISTVNMASPMAGIVLFSDFTHTWGYTELSIREVLTLAGFSKIKVFGYRFPKGVVGVIRTFFRKIVLWVFWSASLAIGMMRLSNMDPALVAVAESDKATVTD